MVGGISRLLYFKTEQCILNYQVWIIGTLLKIHCVLLSNHMCKGVSSHIFHIKGQHEKQYIFFKLVTIKAA